jgi:putative oxidoreductase
MTIQHSALIADAISGTSSSAFRPLIKLMHRAIATSSSSAPTVARLALGLVLFPHGAQHAFGSFGGYGFSATLGWMTGTFGFPAPLAAIGIVTEVVAPVLLVLGVAGRLAAVLSFAFMAFAASTHVGTGFFMNWFGALPAGHEGFEYHLLAMALALVVVIAGSGAWSLDARLTKALARR